MHSSVNEIGAYNTCVCVNAYASVGCGVLATIEQWYHTRKFNGTMVPHKRNSIVWPHLVTKEKTIKHPTSAMCRVCVSRMYNVCSFCRNFMTFLSINNSINDRIQ